MKRMQIALATLVMMTAGAVATWAQTATPGTCSGCGQQQGQRKGKKMGPQDGSGPHHPGGPGGGNGGGGGHRRGGGRR
jgi:hypothetical protein